MYRSSLVLITAVLLAACATEAPTSEATYLVEDTCVADKADFENWLAVDACAKPNPARRGGALDALVKAGGACTATERDGTCTSIEPVTDDWTHTLATKVSFVCWAEPYCDVRGNCEIRETCCIFDLNFPLLDHYCGWRPLVLN